jgi:hypothetical protein
MTKAVVVHQIFSAPTDSQINGGEIEQTKWTKHRKSDIAAAVINEPGPGFENSQVHVGCHGYLR